MSNSKRQKIVHELLRTTERKFSDDELMDMLIEHRSREDDDIEDKEEKKTFGQKAADGVAKFAGSWAFIFSFLGMMLTWMIINIILAKYSKAFDGYPFILLNLVLSCIAAIQAPLIMMSQNRQESKDRTRAENDYKINLRNELIIDDLHIKLERVLENQKEIISALNEIKDEEDDINKKTFK